MKSVVKRFLRRLGWEIVPLGFLNEKLAQTAGLTGMLVSRISMQGQPGGNTVEGIVFSKDRALQLHALLSTYLDKVSDPVRLTIIYEASTKEHMAAYDEVSNLFRGHDFVFVRQSEARGFRGDLLDVLGSLTCRKVFFLVDDIVFKESTDLRDLASYDSLTYVPSIRLGKNLARCYTMQIEQRLPEFIPCEADHLCWKWQAGEFDWNYPLSVDGHIFDRGEMLSMVKSIDFRAPNSFESNLQIFRPVFLERYGICYETSRVVNLPCNKVQNENDNICGNLSSERLLNKWQEGKRMRYESLYGVFTESAHQDLPIEFVERERKSDKEYVMGGS